MLYFDTLADAQAAQKNHPDLPIIHQTFVHMGEAGEVWKIDTSAKAIEQAHFRNIRALYSDRDHGDLVEKMGRLD